MSTVLSSQFLSAEEVKEFQDLLTTQEGFSLILEKLTVRGGTMLDFELEKVFTKAIQKRGTPVADILLQNIQTVQVSQSHIQSALQLSTVLLEHTSLHAASRFLLLWHLPLLTNKLLLQKVCIENRAELSFYENIIEKCINSPGIYDQQLSELILNLCINSSEWMGQILDCLKNVYTKIDVSDLIKYLVENKVHLEILYEKLELIGNVTHHSMQIIPYILAAYPEKKVKALFAYLKNTTNSLTVYGSTLDLLAKEVTQEELPLLLEPFQSSEKAYWPRQVVINLVLNPNIPLEYSIQSKMHLGLYKNVVYYARDILDTGNKVDTFDSKRFFECIISDPAFTSLEGTLHSGLIYELVNRKDRDDLDAVRITFLEKVDFRFAHMFTDIYFEALRGYTIANQSAIVILEKIVQLGKYPFGSIEFLAQLLASTNDSLMKKFILGSGQTLLGAAQSEKLYLLLSERNPYNFAPLYIFNRKILSNNYSKYSDISKQIYKNCYKKLRFGQKLKILFLS